MLSFYLLSGNLTLMAGAIRSGRLTGSRIAAIAAVHFTVWYIRNHGQSQAGCAERNQELVHNERWVRLLSVNCEVRVSRREASRSDVAISVGHNHGEHREHGDTWDQ